MKRNETQVTIKDNNYVLCHLTVFVGTGSTFSFKLMKITPNNSTKFNNKLYKKSLVWQNFVGSDKI